MLNRLNAFEAEEILLRTLVNDLDGLLCVLEQRDREWTQSFDRLVGDLEIEWAVAVERGQRALDESAKKRIRETTAHLKQLVLAQIEPDEEERW